MKFSDFVRCPNPRLRTFKQHMRPEFSIVSLTKAALKSLKTVRERLIVGCAAVVAPIQHYHTMLHPGKSETLQQGIPFAKVNDDFCDCVDGLVLYELDLQNLEGVFDITLKSGIGRMNLAHQHVSEPYFNATGSCNPHLVRFYRILRHMWSILRLTVLAFCRKQARSASSRQETQN